MINQITRSRQLLDNQININYYIIEEELKNEYTLNEKIEL